MSKDQKEATDLVATSGYAIVDPNTVKVAYEEEMDGLNISFDRVKIPSGGGIAFEVPGDDPESPDTVKELKGVIVDHYPINAYWANKYSGSNDAPDCSSMDGKVGVDQEGKKFPCNSCPQNAWGSDPEGGKGKACKNMRRVYILREGEMFPMLLTVPPTSLGNVADFIAKRIVQKGRRSYDVVTKVTLKKDTNAGGIVYSKAFFAVDKELTPDEAKAMAAFSASVKPATRGLAIAGDDFGATETSDEVM